jgi:hypothetical protein
MGNLTFAQETNKINCPFVKFIRFTKLTKLATSFERCGFGSTFSRRSFDSPSPMYSLLDLDQTTLANMTAALDYVYRKLPQDRDLPAIRKYIADEIIVAAHKGQTSLGDLSSVGLGVVNSYLFPPGRSWLRALKG